MINVMCVSIMSILEYAYMILDLKNINVLHIYAYETICFGFEVGSKIFILYLLFIDKITI
jgi:hypothetical protein